MRSQVWLGTCHQGIGAGNLMMSQVQVELYQGTQWSVSLSSGWVINYHQVFMVIPYFLVFPTSCSFTIYVEFLAHY